MSLSMVDGVRIDEEGIRITIVFARARDPFAQAIRKRSEEAVASRYPQYAGKISVFVKEAPPKKKNERQTVPLGADDCIRREMCIRDRPSSLRSSSLPTNPVTSVTCLPARRLRSIHTRRFWLGGGSVSGSGSSFVRYRKSGSVE